MTPQQPILSSSTAQTSRRGRAALSALLFGPALAVVLALTILTLPALVPGYDGVRQTVSEIGEAGSPARLQDN